MCFVPLFQNESLGEIFHMKMIKQLLDDVEHDIMNYQNRGLCYLPKTKAEADNTDTTSGLLSMLRSDWLSY